MERCWYKSLLVLAVISLFELSSQQNMRVAPGVPPQHYDPNVPQHQQPPPNYQQPPPPQYQQQQHVPQQQQFQQQQQQVNMGHGQAVPIQQQQHQQPPPPVQHQQQPVQHQPPQGGGGGGHHQGAHGHGHTHHGQPQPLLDASNIGNSEQRAHIQEHMDLPIDTSKMSEQELQFHYFKMHDADNNNKLDGCELVKSLIHWHDQANHDPASGQPIPDPKIFNDDELTNMIDPILANDDRNKDGFIDYGEFVQAQAQAANRQASQHAA